jgi:uncharacterized protein
VPRGRVGTVDRFQGQQAPVVIYSITTSSQDEAPHGMEFLFSRHRLNVATSRARCVCILVGTPQIFEPNCPTPKQMQMANAFCAYLERAVIVHKLIKHPEQEPAELARLSSWGKSEALSGQERRERNE